MVGQYPMWERGRDGQRGLDLRGLRFVISVAPAYLGLLLSNSD